METFPQIVVENAGERSAGPLRSRIGPLAACILSSLAHAGLLVWMATLLLPARPIPVVTLVTGGWEHPLDESTLPVRLAVAPSASMLEVDLPAVATQALSTPGSSGFEASPIGELNVSTRVAESSQGNSPREGAGKGQGDGPGDGDGGTGGAGGPATFFDIPLPSGAEKFVFIVDASGSMHGKRFERARRELLYTLKRLGSNHRFYVLFFNEYDFPQFHPTRTREFAAVTPENIARVEQWAAHFRPAGDTHPMSAFRKALELRPDAIYFLSDGAFEVRTLDLIKQFNKQKTVIHTIGLEEKGGEALLEEIAKRNGGRYQFVP